MKLSELKAWARDVIAKNWRLRKRCPRLTKISVWQGQDGTCEICGELVSNHPDWALPDRVVKYCNGKRNHGKTSAR